MDYVIPLMDIVETFKLVNENCNETSKSQLQLLLDFPPLYTNFRYNNLFNFIIIDEEYKWGESHTSLKTLINLKRINVNHKVILSQEQTNMFMYFRNLPQICHLLIKKLKINILT
jgi:hypothetical protein